MYSGLPLVVAISTAAAVALVAVMLAKLMNTLVGGASGVTADGVRFRRFLDRMSTEQRAGGRQPRERRDAVAAVAAVKASATPPAAAETAPAAAPPTLPETIDEAAPAVEPPSYGRIGDEVTAVLTAAEQAASEIRATALREAEETRRAAEERAAAIAAEAETTRSESDRYRDDTLAEAEAGAEETRMRAEAEAARTVELAEERARRAQSEAERRVNELEAAGARRREMLAETLVEMDKRIEWMLQAFRRGTAELEQLLPEERPEEARQDAPLYDDLKPRSTTGDRRDDGSS